MWCFPQCVPCPYPSLKSSSVPKNGKKYTMYHGTTAEAAKLIQKNGFRQSKNGTLGQGVYVSRDIRKASSYPKNLPKNKRVVLMLGVKVGKVKKIDRPGHPMQFTWHTVYKFDTAWCPPNCPLAKNGLEEDCVWDPKRIKVVKAIHPKKG